MCRRGFGLRGGWYVHSAGDMEGGAPVAAEASIRPLPQSPSDLQVADRLASQCHAIAAKTSRLAAAATQRVRPGALRRT
jgi:hypothetical protein